MINLKRKGADGEREVAILCRNNGYNGVRRTAGTGWWSELRAVYKYIMMATVRIQKEYSDSILTVF